MLYLWSCHFFSRAVVPEWNFHFFSKHGPRDLPFEASRAACQSSVRVTRSEWCCSIWPWNPLLTGHPCQHTRWRDNCRFTCTVLSRLPIIDIRFRVLYSISGCTHHTLSTEKLVIEVEPAAASAVAACTSAPRTYLLQLKIWMTTRFILWSAFGFFSLHRPLLRGLSYPAPHQRLTSLFSEGVFFYHHFFSVDFDLSRGAFFRREDFCWIFDYFSFEGDFRIFSCCRGEGYFLALFFLGGFDFSGRGVCERGRYV